jgi:hypothetical protein
MDSPLALELRTSNLEPVPASRIDMSTISRGALKGLFAPEYGGNSILNLLASIVKAQGGRSPHTDLAALPSAALRRFRKIVYLVADGAGEGQIRDYLKLNPRSPFFARKHAVITTVFPATTASAVTTFGTGASPAEHGIIGWHLNLPDLGLVSTILPAVTRTGSPIALKDFDLGKYLGLPAHMGSTRGRRDLLSYGHIPFSRYSRAGGRWHRRISFTTLTGLEREVLAFARRPGRGLAYVYWPQHDTLCHEHGCADPRTLRHLARIDRTLARLAAALSGTDTILIVTADHGLVDAPPAHRVDLRDVPGLYDCLATLPCGDARLVHCFVRPARVRAFLEIARRRLGRACVCVRGTTLLKLGLFGPGPRHPALAARVGDFALIAKGDYAFGSSLPGAKSEFNVANHGGMSAREMRVPMYGERDET